MQGRLKFRNQQEVERAQAMGIKEMDKKYSLEELAGGEVMFAATGVTDGDYLEGIHFSADGATSQSIVMRSKTCTIRVINATHNFALKPGF
jgi:fructose-1,6-bisphosphatase II